REDPHPPGAWRNHQCRGEHRVWRPENRHWAGIKSEGEPQLCAAIVSQGRKQHRPKEWRIDSTQRCQDRMPESRRVPRLDDYRYRLLPVCHSRSHFQTVSEKHYTPNPYCAMTNASALENSPPENARPQCSGEWTKVQ